MAALSDPLDEVLTSKAKLRILRLHLNSVAVHSTREMARRTGMTKRAMDLALAELTALGLMVREPGVTWAPYRINREHELVIRALEPLFAAEIAFVDAQWDALRELIDTSWRGAAMFLHWAGIFGSVARDEATPKSDLDLAMVIDSAEQVGLVKDRTIDASEAFDRRFGRRVSVMVVSADQFRRLYADSDSVAHALIRDGRRLAGETDLERLGRGEQD